MLSDAPAHAGKGDFLLRFFSTFPGGAPGTGLLLLRIAVGIVSAFHGVLYLTAPGDLTTQALLLGLLALLSGGMLFLGLLTPAVGIITALSWISFPTQPPLIGFSQSVFLGTVCVAVALIGPGAYSLDAWFFGRREIIIPPAPRSRL